MSSYEVEPRDAEILGEIRELAEGISDERMRVLLRNVTGVLELNPQPIPPGVLRTLLEAIALNPQPLPPGPDDDVDAVALNPQPLPPGPDDLQLNPQPEPPG